MIKLEELPEYTLIRVSIPEFTSYDKVFVRTDDIWINIETYWDVVSDGDPDNELVGFEIVSLPITHYIEDDALKVKEV